MSIPSIAEVVSGTPYAGYLYSYPHKTAYRPLSPEISLRELWAGEDKSSLFLYFHVPFCEMRCGFCNLFTAARPREEVVAAFLTQLAVQARVVSEAIGGLEAAQFSRFAIGGGTPTYLSAAELSALFEVAASSFGVSPSRIPTSVETSPETATRDRLRVLAAHGVSRISIGVQSFVESEVSSVSRPQETARVHAALDAIRSEKFAALNIDLIYGLPEQTEATLEVSLRAALAYRPEELYLYPLYVRPLTGLGRRGRSWDDQRIAHYRFARELLASEGYTPVSMRMFRSAAAMETPAPSYRCQTDGMIGLGPGARSYARGLHYSNEYAVSARGVKAIIADWNSRPAERFALADYGITLDLAEQKRRYTILSLLAEGLDVVAYRALFGSEVFADIPELAVLESNGLASASSSLLRLTDAGRERSDAIGPYLCSPRVRERMAEYQLT